MKVALLRLDASFHLGMGHLMRCLALAQALFEKRVKPVFVYRNYSSYINKKLKKYSFEGRKFPAVFSLEEDLDFTARLIQEYRAELVMVDLCNNESMKDLSGYENYLKALGQAGTRLLVIDDLNALPFQADWVLNPNYGAEKLPYINRNQTKYLLGPKYFLFRQEFSEAAAKQRRIRRQVSRVLVTLGGSDLLNIAPKVIRALIQVSKTHHMELVVIYGMLERNNDISFLLNAFNGKYSTCASSDNMAELMLWCDLAITAGGLTKYETAITGTPSIIISQVDHQYELTELFLREGTALHLGLGSEVSEEKIRETVEGLLYDYNQRLKMSLNGKRLVDGKGAQRVVEVLTSL